MGAVMFPYGLVPRARLKKAVLKSMERIRSNGYTIENWRQSVSYLGLLKHTRSFHLQEKLRLSYFTYA